MENISRMMDFFCKIKLPFLLVFLSVALFAGCSDYRDIRVGACTLESISPSGLKSVDAGLSVDIYNPAKEIRISEISGTVYYESAPIGFFEAPEVTVPGKSSSAVDIDIRATLGDSLNIMQIMSMASGFRTESLTLDISMNIKVKGGLKKKIDLKGVPVDDFIGKVKYESV